MRDGSESQLLVHFWVDGEKKLKVHQTNGFKVNRKLWCIQTSGQKTSHLPRKCVYV